MTNEGMVVQRQVEYECRWCPGAVFPRPTHHCPVGPKPAKRRLRACRRCGEFRVGGLFRRVESVDPLEALRVTSIEAVGGEAGFLLCSGPGVRTPIGEACPAGAVCVLAVDFDYSDKLLGLSREEAVKHASAGGVREVEVLPGLEPDDGIAWLHEDREGRLRLVRGRPRPSLPPNCPLCPARDIGPDHACSCRETEVTVYQVGQRQHGACIGLTIAEAAEADVRLWERRVSPQDAPSLGKVWLTRDREGKLAFFKARFDSSG